MAELSEEALAYNAWACKAEMDFGESGFSCSRPNGHEGHHFDWLRWQWWSDSEQDPPADAKSPFGHPFFAT